MDTRITFKSVRPNSCPGDYQSIGRPDSPSRIDIQIGRAREFAMREPSGVFSLKWIPQGAALYRVDRARHRLSGQNVLLLNAGQAYDVEFLECAGTESLCLFFSDALLREAWDGLRMDPRTIDAAHGPCPPTPPAFPDLVYRPDAMISDFLTRLRQPLAMISTPLSELEEPLLQFLEHLIAISQNHRRLAARLPAGKAATRRMLFARLQRAREMIEDMHDAVPTLDELAAASCLSKFHMLRLFKAMFGCTPLRYAEGCKIRRAMLLLKSSRLPLTEVAAAVGYASQSGFTRAFHRHAGITPAVFRARQ